MQQLEIQLSPPKPACIVDECDRPVKSRGYCNAHYLKLMRRGDPTVCLRAPRVARVGECPVDGCVSPVHCGGYCGMHYSRMKRHGSLDERPRWQPKNRLCQYVGCERKHASKGYCSKHYQRLKKTGYPWLVVGKPNNAFPTICSVATCARWVCGIGLCSMHLQRHYVYGTPTPEKMRNKRTTDSLTCVVDGCGKPLKGLDYCAMHYSRLLRYGSVSPSGLRNKVCDAYPDDAVCIVSDCQKRPMARMKCRRHFHQEIRASDPLRHKVYGMKRRARIAAGYVYDYSDDAVKARMAYWGNKCWMCGGPFECIDHVKPLKAGGKDCPANFRPACTKCNCEKNAKWFGVSELHRFLK